MEEVPVVHVIIGKCVVQRGVAVRVPCTTTAVVVSTELTHIILPGYEGRGAEQRLLL